MRANILKFGSSLTARILHVGDRLSRSWCGRCRSWRCNAVLNQPFEVGTIRPLFATWLALGTDNQRPDLLRCTAVAWLRVALRILTLQRIWLLAP